MNQIILTSLMKLFALVASYKRANQSNSFEDMYVSSFLKTQFNIDIEEEYITMFNQFKEQYRSDKFKKNKMSLSLSILKISEEINKELSQQQKYYLILSLISFTRFSDKSLNEVTNESIDTLIETVSDAINIEKSQYQNLKAFIEQKIHLLQNKENLLIIGAKKGVTLTKIKRLSFEGLESQITLFYLPEVSLFLLSFKGKGSLRLNKNMLVQNHTYYLGEGSVLYEENFGVLTFNDLVKQISGLDQSEYIQLETKNLTFHFKNSSNGIQNLNIQLESNQLLGILGGSGTGKTTLINLLNGTLKPKEGQVLVNGYPLSELNTAGLIGNVPQDDLLIEDLTVYENLYYYGKLCFGDLSLDELNERIDRILSELGLFEIKHLKVGSPLNKVISGGQRKRVNIALELLKDPKIIFLDEPTSGLSSADTENVMFLLKSLTLKGKIVVANIHQPGFDVFKILDKVLFLDLGGYPIYFGLPIESFAYFNRIANKVVGNSTGAESYKYFEPGKILNIIEEKKVGPFGEFTQERRISPTEWHEHYLNEISTQKPKFKQEGELQKPSDSLKLPSKGKQTLIYFSRTLKTRFNDTQYKLINLLISPVLALVLAIFSKQFIFDNDGQLSYQFYNNDNIPIFIFMMVTVVLFLALMLSAEEIIVDRKLIKREGFNNLSPFSYINSKVLYLLLVSLIQVAVFVSISLLILRMGNFIPHFILILLLSSLFALLLGLYISAKLKSKAAIYITIPIILIPQILLSGAVLDYDKINPKISSQEYTPIFGDLMASRWTYEGLMVSQFTQNKYQKLLINYDQEISLYSNTYNYILPSLEDELNKNGISPLIKHEVAKLNQNFPIVENPFERENADVEWLRAYLSTLKRYIRQEKTNAVSLRDAFVIGLGDEKGKDYLLNIKKKYSNKNLNNFVLNSNKLERIIKTNNQLVLKYEPIYKQSHSRIGRSHLFAKSKRIGNLNVYTPIFNGLVMLVMSILVYVLVYKQVRKEF